MGADHPEDESIDAEITEADLGEHETRALDLYSEPEFIDQPKPPSKARYWWLIVLAIVVAGAVYLIFVRDEDATQATEPLPAGLADLWDCADMVSLDGTKELKFFDDWRAVMYDKAKRNERGKYLVVEGTWSFDENTKLYTVTLNGESAAYSMAEPGGGDCMLVKGDFGAANLRESWFRKPLGDPED
jgi:hypothetical protein